MHFVRVLARSPKLWPEFPRCEFSVLVSSVQRNSANSRFMVRKGYQEQQLRFRRHDRASAFSKPRPKTRKQRQAYNRKMKRIEDEKARHNPPGSKAGPRRQFVRERWQQLLNHSGNSGKELSVNEENIEYGMEDALMEDMLGNSAHLTAQPTPEPLHLGHMHKKYFNVVADAMDNYRRAIDAQAAADAVEDGDNLVDTSSLNAKLPSDKDISNVLRAYRDRHGTRNKPIGIVMALQHCINDLSIPTVSFGEHTFTTLLTCCRTPMEARRIFKLMNDRQHPISSYSWSILVDIHSKVGDFEGCAEIIKEMAREGTPPTQAAYTSLLAACYKVCNDGRIPHSIRAKAGKIGWQNWQEMRIVGVEADAMAYGAIIRLCAARGQAERAINLLQEMNRFEVKPTTLCFSGALRAVARSHEIGIRFERGSSRKQLRRELFASHHGKMAREIVIMAENAEVEQDEGFVSALMLCAAAAGDSATAKAVFLASEIRKMDFLRTIGSDASLEALRGKQEQLVSGEPDAPSLTDGLVGTHNIIEQEQEATSTHVLTQQSPQVDQQVLSFQEREYGKDTRSLSALLRACGQALHSNGIGTIWTGQENQGYLCENSLRLITTRWEPSYSKSSIPSEQSTKFGISSLRRYDDDKRDVDPQKTRTRKKFRGLYLDDESEDIIKDYAAYYDTNTDDDDAREFLERKNSDTMSQDSRDQGQVLFSKRSLTNSEPEEVQSVGKRETALQDAAFMTFYEELNAEARLEGLEEAISEQDALELYEMMQEEFGVDLDSDDSDFEDNLSLDEIAELETLALDKIKESNIESLDAGDGGDIAADGVPSPRDTKEGEDATNLPSEDHDGISREVVEYDGGLINSIQTVADSTPEMLKVDEEDYEKLLVLEEALPGLPVSRLKAIVKAFDSTLVNPSLLSLVPILRETMPDHITSGWLKRKNSATAEFVLEQAKSNDLVNAPLLNGMLQVKTSAGSLDEAERFHEEEFNKHRMKPSQYSDRLILQMLVSNNRLQRALVFKEKRERQKQSIDIPSYGSLVEYYARHHQLGSSLMLIRECIDVHGSPPSEKYLTRVRVLYRQMEAGNERQLAELIGEDPTEWLKHGERHLKREHTKKGRRDVKKAYNRALG